jgi:hypothetical protein
MNPAALPVHRRCSVRQSHGKVPAALSQQTTCTDCFDAQAIFCRRRHQARRPPPARIRPGSPAPAIGPGTLLGATWISPNKPSNSPFIPASKYNALGSKPAPPFPILSAHKPELVIGFPMGSSNVPTKWPDVGSKASIVPSPLLPTSSAPANSPKPAGAIARPHGALRLPFETSLTSPLGRPGEPSKLKTPFGPSVFPTPGFHPAISYVTYSLPLRV